MKTLRLVSWDCEWVKEYHFENGANGFTEENDNNFDNKNDPFSSLTLRELRDLVCSDNCWLDRSSVDLWFIKNDKEAIIGNPGTKMKDLWGSDSVLELVVVALDKFCSISENTCGIGKNIECIDGNVGVRFDPISLKAAIDFYSNQQRSRQELFSLLVSESVLGVDTPVVDVEQDNAERIVAGVNVLPEVNWIQWSVLLRLIIVGFLFTYNRNISYAKLGSMIGTAIFVYLFQIRALEFWLILLCNKLGINLNAAAIPPDQGREVNPDVGNDDAAMNEPHADDINLNREHRGEARRFRFVESFKWVLELYRNGLTIPTEPGIVYDAISFLMGMVLSLIPRWAPYRI